MIANDILLDAFTRVHESLHRTLGDITSEELVKELQGEAWGQT